MSSSEDESRDQNLLWRPVAGAQAIVFVAKSGERPVAIIELRPGLGFYATTCVGDQLGPFVSLDEGQAAVEEWLVARERVSAAS